MILAAAHDKNWSIFCARFAWVLEISDYFSTGFFAF